jgi:hypothetical protein
MRLVVTKRNYDSVNTRADGAPGTGIPLDTYRERLIKYIPVEVLVLYIATYGSTYAIFSYQPYFPLIARSVLLLGIFGTSLWLWKVERVNDGVQLVISTVGFVVWVFAFGVVPVAELPGYNQIAAALFLPVYVFGIPLVEGVPDSW